MKIIVIASTNAKIDQINPALTRPGRMEWAIDFHRIPASEGAAWLGMPVGKRELTLAELYDAKQGGELKSEKEAPVYGIYL